MNNPYATQRRLVDFQHREQQRRGGSWDQAKISGEGLLGYQVLQPRRCTIDLHLKMVKRGRENGGNIHRAP